MYRAFGAQPFTQTRLDYRQVTSKDVWIDDPASPSYNQWLTVDTPPTVSHEVLLRPDGQYDHAIVIEYNTAPIIPAHGSAIFIHIWKSPNATTAGCIGMEKPTLIQFLTWLDPQKKPVIMIKKTKLRRENKKTEKKKRLSKRIHD